MNYTTRTKSGDFAFSVDVERKDCPYSSDIGYVFLVLAKDKKEARRKTNRWCEQRMHLFRAFNIRRVSVKEGVIL